MSSIKTGVDRLMELISREKKVELKNAAKSLGVGLIVVEEWAEFLEEEELITIDRKFTKTVLLERELTKKQVEQKSKDYVVHKGAFIRKVESTIEGMQIDNESFQKIKGQFDKLKGEIGDEVDKVKEELGQLQKYEELKHNIDKDIARQNNEYMKLISKSEKDIQNEQKKYKHIIGEVEDEEVNIKYERQSLGKLHEKSALLDKKVEEISGALKRLQEEIAAKEHEIDDSERHIKRLHGVAEKVRTDLENQKKKKIDPLIAESKAHALAIDKLQQQIVAKAKQTKASINKYSSEGVRISKRFTEFFEKRKEVMTLLHKIEKDKIDMEEELKLLVKKAQAFDAIKKSTTVAKQVKELEDRFEEVEARRNKFKNEIMRLVSLVKK